LLGFLAGVVFLASVILESISDSFEFKARGALWGSLLIFSCGFGVWFLEGKSGIFILSLLYLILWQIENKTLLSRIYDQWYWVMRTKLTMLVVSCFMLVWMILPN
jgi:hypothetical protein